jgi:hypothetical protein
MRKLPTQTLLLIFLYASNFVTFTVGCVLNWIGFIVSSSALVQSLGYSSVGYIIVSCGLLLIFLSLLGAFSTYTEKTRLILLFSLFGLITGSLMLIAGGLILYVRELSGQMLMSESTCLEHLATANNLTVIAGNVMCSLYCPCELSNSAFSSSDLLLYQGSAASVLDCNPCENIQTYSQDTQTEIEDWVQTQLGYQINETACAVTAAQFTDAYFPASTRKYVTFVAWMEENFGCSGVCTKENLFLFSDVTRTPNGPCYHHLKYWAHESFQSYGAVAIVFGAFQTISSIVAIIMACKKKKVQIFTEEMPTKVMELAMPTKVFSDGTV